MTHSHANQQLQCVVVGVVVCVVLDLVMVQLHVARLVLVLVFGAEGPGVAGVARAAFVYHCFYNRLHCSHSIISACNFGLNLERS